MTPVQLPEVPVQAGDRFCRLTAVAEAGRGRGGRIMWSFACDCGGGTVADISGVKRGRISSCGCIRRESAANVGRVTAEARKVHGHAGQGKISPEYHTWRSMISRCTRPSHKNYPLYGGRGIKVCAAWGDFSAFLMDMGRRPSPIHSIDRIDPDGDYTPENCRWATNAQQAENKRNSIRIPYQGREWTPSELSEFSGLRASIIRYRFSRGWSVERILSTPPLRDAITQPEQNSGR